MSCGGSTATCNEHPYGCPEGSHHYYPGYAKAIYDYSVGPGNSEKFTWQELESFELRARRIADALDWDGGGGQLADLFTDLAETCELLAAMVHHVELLDNPESKPENPVSATPMVDALLERMHQKKVDDAREAEAASEAWRKDRPSAYEDSMTRRTWSEQEIADLVRQYSPHIELTNLERATGIVPIVVNNRAFEQRRRTK